MMPECPLRKNSNLAKRISTNSHDHVNVAGKEQKEIVGQELPPFEWWIYEL